ncbi:hypothetical protein JW960_25605 [candidate division KSB1 bacterium]|nr:hypothetical protein [candidate division KSB1 bacterium]
MMIFGNTSPIINLTAIDHLDLLYRLYQTIIIPQAFFNEIVITGTGQPGSNEVKEAEWIQTQSFQNISS